MYIFEIQKSIGIKNKWFEKFSEYKDPLRKINFIKNMSNKEMLSLYYVRS